MGPPSTGRRRRVLAGQGEPPPRREAMVLHLAHPGRPTPAPVAVEMALAGLIQRGLARIRRNHLWKRHPPVSDRSALTARASGRSSGLGSHEEVVGPAAARVAGA